MYFLAKYKDSSPSITRPDEVKALKILKLEDAINTIEYDNKKEMLKKADSYLKSKAENTIKIQEIAYYLQEIRSKHSFKSIIILTLDYC